MTNNYGDSSHTPRIIDFLDVKDKFKSDYWIDLEKGAWGAKFGSWVDCKIGGGWGYISRDTYKVPEYVGVFDRTNTEHLNTLSFMIRRAETPNYGLMD